MNLPEKSTFRKEPIRQILCLKNVKKSTYTVRKQGGAKNMSKLLYIETSPRKIRSSSIAIAKEFLNEYVRQHPADTVSTIDLWEKKLVEFDGDVIEAKYAIMHNKPHTKEQREAWKKVEEVISEFTSADKYVISLPMWNFGIPYTLKHYIDILLQPGYTFKVTPEGKYEGLVLGKKVLLVYARGGAYGPKSGAEALDYQTTYMETILSFIGFSSIDSIIIEPTLAGEEKKKEALIEARNKILKIATSF